MASPWRGWVIAKRFTDSEKWKRPWFRALSNDLKVVWFYLLDQCDHAGIWVADFALLEFQTGVAFDSDTFLAAFDGKLIRAGEDKFHIPSFIEFQYGELNPENRAHLSVLKALEKVGLNKPLTSPSQGAKDKDKDKDKESSVFSSFSEGGVGETKPSLTQAPLEGLFKTWQATLKHFKIERSLSEQEKLEIARAAQKHGTEIVNLALQGARYEAKSDGFDPSQHVSIQRVLKPDRNGVSKLDKFANLGSANQSVNKPERVWDPKTKTYVEVSS